MLTIDHKLIKPYLDRIVSSYYSEEVTVGLHAIRGIESLVRVVTEGRDTGGRSKTCRALLRIVSMCLSKGLDDDSCVSRGAIYRHAFPSMTTTSARRLLTEGEKKRKKFEEGCLRDFRAVDKDAKRWKYSEQEIHELREWMTTNRECLHSPNEKDHIRERDLFGASNHVVSILLYHTTLLTLFYRSL